MKKILIINGHPDKASFCTSLAESYLQGTKKTQVDATLIHLTDLTFTPILQFGYRHRTELEHDLLKMQQLIKEADHLVFIYPIWWGTAPALLKGFIDRVFLPRFAFKYQPGARLPEKLLRGKTARVIVTMDAPVWWYYLVYRRPGDNGMERATLKFCGIKPVRFTHFGSVKNSTLELRQSWLQRVEYLGASMQ